MTTMMTKIATKTATPGLTRTFTRDQLDHPNRRQVRWLDNSLVTSVDESASDYRETYWAVIEAEDDATTWAVTWQYGYERDEPLDRWFGRDVIEARRVKMVDYGVPRWVDVEEESN